MNFTKEEYLDLITNFNDRRNLTRLRISAHNLEIETGRHKEKGRSERICSWCYISLGIHTIENEDHFLNVCDLYAINRKITSQKLTNTINSSSCTYETTHHNLIRITTAPHCNTITHHSHILPCELLSDTNRKILFFQAVSRFVSISFNRRKKFLQPPSGVT